MKKIIVVVVGITMLFACSSKKEGNMVVKGQIKGLKKGTLYLQKMQDTVLVSVDSVALLGKDLFTLTDDVDSPEMYYLTFDGNTTDKRILFFGEQGNITINDDVKKFGIQPQISGSVNQKLLDDYYKITRRLNEENLTLIKENFEARKAKDEEKIKAIAQRANHLLKRRYLYTANFAVNNGSFEVAPYLALTQLVNANVKLLDTIQASLTPKVKNSKYGKKLDKFISDIKKSEQK